MPTLSDVAKQAGVSTATVSRTFNMPQLLNEETRRRVLDAAAALQYKPRSRQAARNRRGQRAAKHATDTIGFQFFMKYADDSVRKNFFYAPLLSGAQAEAAELGLNVLISQTSRSEFADKLPKMIRERSISGMLLVGAADEEALATFLRLVPQIVLVDEPDAENNHDCILSDGFDGVYQATQYLVELGHRRIAFIIGDGVPTFQERYHGYICALHDAGIVPDNNLLVRGVIEFGIENDITALVKSQAATAIVAANDAHALLAMQVCRDLGVSVPNDMSIVGFDDIEASAHTYPRLTTVRVDKEHMGRLAVRRIHARLTDDRLRNEPPLLIKTLAQLVVRESCASPAKP